MERQKIIENIVNDFGALKRKMVVARHHHRHNITPAQGQALFLIRHHGQLTTSEIAKFLGITVSAATQLCEPLIQNGFLLRQPNPKDGRSFALVLSRRSVRHMTRFKNNTFDRINRLFEPLTDNELEQFSEITRKMINHINSYGQD